VSHVLAGLVANARHSTPLPLARREYGTLTSRIAADCCSLATAVVAAALLAKAAGGDVPAITSLADRTDGKVAQALIGDSEEDGVPLVHTITRKLSNLMRNLKSIGAPLQ
jgi:hydrogenase maturation factor